MLIPDHEYFIRFKVSQESKEVKKKNYDDERKCQVCIVSEIDVGYKKLSV